MKKCTKCGRELPPSEFHKHRITKDGLCHICKDCSRERGRAFSRTASGQYTSIKSRQKFYEKNQPYRYKPVLISRDDFIKWYNAEPKVCHYCGLSEKKMSTVNDFYNSKGSQLSVDAKDNNIGYVEGNLVLACHRCNGIKSDFFTYEEMLMIGREFVKPKWYIEYISDLGEKGED